MRVFECSGVVGGSLSKLWTMLTKTRMLKMEIDFKKGKWSLSIFIWLLSLSLSFYSSVLFLNNFMQVPYIQLRLFSTSWICGMSWQTPSSSLQLFLLVLLPRMPLLISHYPLSFRRRGDRHGKHVCSRTRLLTASWWLLGVQCLLRWWGRTFYSTMECLTGNLHSHLMSLHVV